MHAASLMYMYSFEFALPRTCTLVFNYHCVVVSGGKDWSASSRVVNGYN